VYSFKNTIGGVRVVEDFRYPVKDLAQAAFTTLVFGWWSIPHGVFWTLSSLIYLWQGGRDVTQEMLTESLGKREAKKILAGARKPIKPFTLWWVRLMILLPTLSLAVLFGMLMKIIWTGAPQDVEYEVPSSEFGRTNYEEVQWKMHDARRKERQRKRAHENEMGSAPSADGR